MKNRENLLLGNIQIYQSMPTSDLVSQYIAPSTKTNIYSFDLKQTINIHETWVRRKLCEETKIIPIVADLHKSLTLFRDT